MNLKNTLLTAAFGLIMSALAVQTAHAQVAPTQAAKSANIQILALPYVITAPGYYVLAHDLTLPSPGVAISLFRSINGAVVVDLRGFTTNGQGDGYAGIVSGYNPGLANSPITIKNGTLKNFGVGVPVGEQTKITIAKIVFDAPSPPLDIYSTTNVAFQSVNNSTIVNCTFNGGLFGIVDYGSSGGNSYNNNTFVKVLTPSYVEQSVLGTLTLKSCQFSPPPSN